MSNDTDLWLALITSLAAGLIFLRIVCKEKARLDRHIHIRELYEERRARLRQLEAEYEQRRTSDSG